MLKQINKTDYPTGQVKIVTKGTGTLKHDNKNLFRGNTRLTCYIDSRGVQIGDNASQSAVSFYAEITPEFQYTCSKTSSSRSRIGTTENIVNGSPIFNFNDNNATNQWTFGADKKCIIWYCYNSAMDTKTQDAVKNSIQIELGDAKTDFITNQHLDIQSVENGEYIVNLFNDVNVFQADFDFTITAYDSGGDPPTPPTTGDIIATFYTSQSSKKVLNKKLTEIVSKKCRFTKNVNILNPSITLAFDDKLLQCDYCFINVLNRYYFIEDLDIFDGRKIEMKLSVDVLKTYDAQIREQNAVVSRQATTGNFLLNDTLYPVQSNKQDYVKSFPNGFDRNGRIVLMIVGD